MRLRLTTTLQHRLERDHDKLQGLQAQLRALGPGNVLQRGYAILLDENGKVVADAEKVDAGDRLEGVLAKGRLELEVKKRKPE